MICSTRVEILKLKSHSEPRFWLFHIYNNNDFLDSHYFLILLSMKSLSGTLNVRNTFLYGDRDKELTVIHLTVHYAYIVRLEALIYI